MSWTADEIIIKLQLNKLVKMYEEDKKTQLDIEFKAEFNVCAFLGTVWFNQPKKTQ